jgi:hypothetical protein
MKLPNDLRQVDDRIMIDDKQSKEDDNRIQKFNVKQKYNRIRQEKHINSLLMN